jgi:hypothetical protein
LSFNEKSIAQQITPADGLQPPLISVVEPVEKLLEA